MKIKLEVIKINNDIIATSSTECEHLNLQHFKIEGTQTNPTEWFNGKYYSFDQSLDTIPVYYSTQFEDQSGRLGWYHWNSLTGSFVWCEHQDHNDFLDNYQSN